MNTFTTQTNIKKNAVYNTVTALVITLIPWTALVIYSVLQDPIMWDMVGIATGAAAVILLALISQAKVNNVYTLRFEGANLYLDGKTKNAHYHIYDIPASDFVLTQSKKDKANNSCSLRIKKTVFYNLKYVENYTELKAYIEANFPTKN